MPRVSEPLKYQIGRVRPLQHLELKSTSFSHGKSWKKSGVYILTGIDPNSGSPRAYIGEAEVIRERLKQHKAKEFWVSAVVFVSKDENLTKALRVLQRQDDSHISSRCEKVLSKTAPFSSKTVFSYLRKMQAFQARARQLPLFMVVA